MKIGYPCINNSIPRNAPSTFRLASYSENRLVQTLKNNLIHLNRILKYNAVYNAIKTVKESSSLQEPEDDKFYTKSPQCNPQLQIARPRNYGSNNPQIHNK